MAQQQITKQVRHTRSGGGDDEPEPFRGVAASADPQIAAAKAARDREAK